MLRRSICLSTLAVSAMLLVAAATAHESDAPTVDPEADTAEFFQALYAWQKEPVTRKTTNAVTAPVPLATNEVSATDFAPYYTALRTWNNESVGDLATAAFEQADCGCATGDDCGCDCASIACDCGCEECNTCGTCCCPAGGGGSGGGSGWKASVAFLALARDLKDAPLITGPGPGFAQRLGSAQFDTGYEPGAEISLRGPLSECDLQIRYIHADSFNETYNRAGLGDDQFPTFAGILAGPETWSYQSRLYNLEINFLRAIPESNFEVFAGLAYVRYEEAVNWVRPVAAGFTSHETENDLFGFQLGLNALLYGTDQFTLEATGRGGLYLARSKSEYIGVASPAFPRDNIDNTAFLGEVGLLANYRIFGNCSLEASYHALWLSGVALAGEQFSSTNTVTTPLNQGDILFHGFNLGIATRW